MLVWILVAVTVAAATTVAVTVAKRRGDRGHEVTVTVATDDKAARMAMVVAVLAGVATTLLTVAAFVRSYAHLEGVAVANGVPAGFHAWLWPGTIDTFIVIGELLILLAAIARLGFSWWGWGLTIGGSAGSIAFNVVGVGADKPFMYYAVAAAPPVAALFAFGALMHQVRRYVATVTDTAAVTDTDTDTDTEDVATDTVTVTDIAPAVMATVTDMAIPPRPTVAPVATVTDDVATVTAVKPRVSVAKRVAGVATDMVTAVDKALVATDTAAMTALMGRPYTPQPTVATVTKPRKRVATKRVTVATPATPEVMAARVATVTAMLRDDPTVDGAAVAARVDVSERTARRILAKARGEA